MRLYSERLGPRRLDRALGDPERHVYALHE
jgi:hypothetical protein